MIYGVFTIRTTSFIWKANTFNISQIYGKEVMLYFCLFYDCSLLPSLRSFHIVSLTAIPFFFFFFKSFSFFFFLLFNFLFNLFIQSRFYPSCSTLWLFHIPYLLPLSPWGCPHPPNSHPTRLTNTLAHPVSWGSDASSLTEFISVGPLLYMCWELHIPWYMLPGSWLTVWEILGSRFFHP
jgi:hypothetical protein